MTAGAVATTASAVVLVAIAIAHYSFGRRGGRVGASLFVIAAFGSLALPLAARGPAVAPPAPIGARQRDPRGWSAIPCRAARLHAAPRRRLARVHPAAGRGRPPAGVRAAPRKGAVMDLATTRPDAAGSGLGRRRDRHVSGEERRAVGGVVLRARRRRGPSTCCRTTASRTRWSTLGFIRDQPNVVDHLAGAAALWSIVSSAGLRVGLVRWPLTYPAESAERISSSAIGSTSWSDRLPSSIVRRHLPRSFRSSSASSSCRIPTPRFAPRRRLLRSLSRPRCRRMRRDRHYAIASRELARGTNAALHRAPLRRTRRRRSYYLSATQPRAFRDETEEERRRQLQAIDAYYAFIDGELDAAAGLSRPRRSAGRRLRVRDAAAR